MRNFVISHRLYLEVEDIYECNLYITKRLLTQSCKRIESRCNTRGIHKSSVIRNKGEPFIMEIACSVAVGVAKQIAYSDETLMYSFTFSSLRYLCYVLLLANAAIYLCPISTFRFMNAFPCWRDLNDWRFHLDWCRRSDWFYCSGWLKRSMIDHGFNYQYSCCVINDSVVVHLLFGSFGVQPVNLYWQ